MTSDKNASLTSEKDQITISQPLDGFTLQKLVQAGLSWLRINQQTVNALNVFPVPDGDTGTNMVLTMQAALDEISNSSENNFGKVTHAIAHGALMGARGNSGVILSQLWRGFARAVDNQETLDVPNLVLAFAMARDTAYKGVVRPVEGTILTVAKDIALTVENTSKETSNMLEILEKTVQAADESVKNTPELLSVLKESGVVDAGGKGLFYILEGMLRYIKGQSLEVPLVAVQPLSTMKINETMGAIEPGQDVEVVVDFYPQQEFNLESFYQDLERIGTSIQLGEGDGIYRLHIHVAEDKQYEPLNYIRSFGRWKTASYENLVEQINTLKTNAQDKKDELAPVEPGQIAVVVVSPGKGISRVFSSLGAAAIIEGGQTMNPSTQEILQAFENLPTDQIIILPNNENIIGAAESAADLSVKQVEIVPSNSIPQGLAAIMHLAPFGSFKDVVKEMKMALKEVQTGEITNATRSVKIDGVSVQEGNFIALLNGKLVFSAPDFENTCLGLLSKIETDRYELVTLFYGNDLSKDEANKIKMQISKAYPELEVEIQAGGQPYYHAIISIE